MMAATLRGSQLKRASSGLLKIKHIFYSMSAEVVHSRLVAVLKTA